MCKHCKSTRIAAINAKCGDLCSITAYGVVSRGFVPKDFGIGGGDYVNFLYCMDCGQIQGNFPLTTTEHEYKAFYSQGPE